MATFIPYEGKKGTTIKAIVRIKGYNTKCKSFPNITLAKSWAKKIEAAMEDGTYIQESPVPYTKIEKVKIEYVSELINYFRENVAPTRYADAHKYDCMFDWWIDKIGDIKVVNLTASDLSACKQILLTEKINNGEPRKANTINKYLMCMSAVLTFARDELELIEYNPMSKVKTVSKPDGRKRYLSIEELAKYLAACKEHSLMIYVFVLIALGTGGRYSEVQHLKVENVDYQNERVYYLDTKNKTSRGVHVEPETLELLKQLCIENNIKSGYIFKGKRGDSLAFIRGTLYQIIREVGLEDFTVHDMRHTFASYSAMNGATLLDIAELLGQKSLAVARRYSHLTQKHTDSIVKNVVKKIIPEV
ncbi:site-specific integrase [bacterium]|nr:site-specific integrase [bacterium]